MKVDLKNFDVDKGQRRMVLIVAVATVISVFCLFSAKSLWSQAAYHRHVLGVKRQTVTQLKQNVDSVNTLKTQYDSFNQQNPNIIGGLNSVGLQNPIPPDGNNSRIVLDALPSTYDFPALISSMSKVMSIDHISSPTIGGEDQSASLSSDPSPTPQPQPISLSLGGTTSYIGAENFIKDLERSIRPFDVTKLRLSGTTGDITVSTTATTYFQPAKILNSDTKEIK